MARQRMPPCGGAKRSGQALFWGRPLGGTEIVLERTDDGINVPAIELRWGGFR